MFNIVIKEGIINEEIYPFANEKERIHIKSYGHKIGLNKSEIEIIEKLDIEEESSKWHTRNVWLIAFYFAGIRISDVLKLEWSDFKNLKLIFI